MDAWIWIKCCMSTDVVTWTNWLSFELDPHYSPDAGTRLLSPISYVLQRGILLCRENPTYRYWAPVAAVRRGFKMVLFTASRGNTFVGGVRSTEYPSSYLRQKGSKCVCPRLSVCLSVSTPEPDCFLRYRIGYGTLQPCLVFWRISRPFPYQFAPNSHAVF